MFSWNSLAFPWSSGCWQFDFWLLCLFYIQLEHQGVHGSRIANIWLENFEYYFTSVWDECNCAVVWAFFVIALLGIGMKTALFQSCGHCWVFQTCWHIECSTFTASSLRIWNSSTGIPSPPLDLFLLMLTNAHLTSHSMMSGSRLVITSSWLSGSWRSFL